jgi:hypothetical protein
MRKTLLLAVTAVLLSFIVFAQEKKPAIISGIVKDAQTKSPLLEAVVTLKSNAFEGEKYAVTDSTGLYRINNLPPGTYSVSFEMEGYEKFSKDGIVVVPGMSLGVSFEMIKEQKRMKKALVKENH